MTGPVLLTGADSVPLRVREELDSLGVPWRAVQDGASPDAWAAAGLSEARAAGLLSPDDLANLDAALLVAELAPECRIVIRLFSTDLRAGVERMLGGRASVLSESELAAPSFLRAALSGNEGQEVHVAHRRLEVAEVDIDDPRLVVALANADAPTEVLPPRNEQAARVLGLVDPEGLIYTARGVLPASVAALRISQQRERERRRRKSPIRGALRLIPSRAYVVLAVIAAVFWTGVTVFALSEHLAFVDAVYFTATTMATVGYGDVNLLGAPDWLKLFDVGLMAVSAVLLASVLALITDVLVTSRIDRALGRFPRPRRDHVIVCGLGKAGAAVLRGLHALEVPCIAIEQHPEAVGVAVARSLEVPVVLADARTPGTLERLHVDTARAVLAVTTDDLANLQVGLAAREESPEVRVVLRMFDARLAERLDRTVELDLTRSVSGLAAPAFAAALLGWPLAQPLPLSSVPLRVLDLAVPPGSALDGRLVRDVHAGRELRVLSLEGAWRPRDDLTITAGMQVSVVGTRAATDALQRPAAVAQT